MNTLASTKSSPATASAVSPIAIEYVTRSLFARKSLRAASKSFFMKFNGEDNLFLGRVDYNIEQIMQAVLADKAALAIQSARRMRAGNAQIAIEGTAQQFNLERDVLATEVLAQLAAEGSEIAPDARDPVARAIDALNAAHPDAIAHDVLGEDLQDESACLAPHP
jgi:hypothetical protein